MTELNLEELQKIANGEGLPEESMEEVKEVEYFKKAGDKKETGSGVEIVYTGKKMDGKKVYIVKWTTGDSGYYYKFDEETLMKVECTDDGSMYNVYKVGKDGKRVEE